MCFLRIVGTRHVLSSEEDCCEVLGEAVLDLITHVSDPCTCTARTSTGLKFNTLLRGDEIHRNVLCGVVVWWGGVVGWSGVWCGGVVWVSCGACGVVIVVW